MGLEGVALVVLASLLLTWSLLARRAERWGITAPMVFIVAGAVLVGGSGQQLSPAAVRSVAELALVLVLFHDASTVRLAALRHDLWISVRLLAIGFPLALLATTAATAWLLPAAGLAGAVLIAAAITPTDAGLGAPTILNPAVPVRVRRALNVESGLNDGLATPVVLAALAVLVDQQAFDGAALPAVLDIGAIPVALGLLVGLGVGLGGAALLDLSRQTGASSLRARGLALVTLPLLCFGVAELVEANGFIAAFVGGLLFGRSSRCIEQEESVSETLESVADLFGYAIWFLAGSLLVVSLQGGFRWQWVVLALAALTVLRLVPVAVAMLGAGFYPPTLLFLGWFGPRGLATIVFGLLAVEELSPGDPLLADVAGVVSITVLVSVLAHGISAGPLSARYGAWVARTHGPIEIEPSVEPMPSRGRAAQQHTPASAV